MHVIDHQDVRVEDEPFVAPAEIKTVENDAGAGSLMSGYLVVLIDSGVGQDARMSIGPDDS